MTSELFEKRLDSLIDVPLQILIKFHHAKEKLANLMEVASTVTLQFQRFDCFTVLFTHRGHVFKTEEASLYISLEVFTRCVAAVKRVEILTNLLSNYLPLTANAHMFKSMCDVPEWDNVSWKDHFLLQLFDTAVNVKKFEIDGRCQQILVEKDLFGVPVYILSKFLTNNSEINRQVHACREKLVEKCKVVWQLMLERAQIWATFYVPNIPYRTVIFAYLAAQQTDFFEKGVFESLAKERILDDQVTETVKNLMAESEDNEKMRLRESLMY